MEVALELVRILRELSRRKRLVALVLGISFLIGFLLAFKPGVPPQSRQYEVALASSSLLVDTRDSQVVSLGKRSPDLPTLASRASLLGNLMSSGPLKNAIAGDAGISPEKLTVVPPANPETPGVEPTPVTTRASREVPDAKALRLSLSADAALPILNVVAQAPDTATARKLSAGTIIGLKRYLGSVAASQDIPAARQLVIRKFGASVEGVATRGLPRRFALAATVFLALLGCGAIVGGSWFVRSWRQMEAAERRGRSDPGEEPIRDLAA